MRSIHRIVLLLIIPLIVKSERPTYEFLRNDISARAAAMAGSFLTMTNDPNVIFYNPAGIGTMTDPQLSLGFTRHLLDINIGSFAYTDNIEEIGKIGFGVQYVNYGTFEGRNEIGVETGNFNAGDAAFSVSFSREYDENLYYGVSGKFIYSSIAEYSSSAIAADFGLLYTIPGDDPISLGLSILHAGTQLDAYNTTTESLPFEVRIGGTIKPQHLPLLLNVNFQKLNESKDSFLDRFSAFTIGGEFLLSKSLRFRFGYNNEERKELKIGTSAGMAGFSLGGGIVLNTIRIDYAYNSMGKIGTINRLSVGLDL